MSKRLSPILIKHPHWGIGFDIGVLTNVTVIDLMFANRTLRIRLQTKAQRLDQEKRMKAFEELRKLSEELEGED